MPDDPITQMASDPDFGKLPLTEQRKALVAHDPSFGKLADADLTQFVSAHQTPRSESAQVQAGLPQPKAPQVEMQPSWWGGMHGTSAQEAAADKLIPQVPQRVADIRKGALQAGGAAFGGEFGQLAKGLPWAMRALAGASGAGFGSGVGTLAGGGSPREALENSAQTTATSAPLSGIAEGAVDARRALAGVVRDPMTGKIRTPWEIAVDKTFPDPYAPQTIPAKPIPKGTNYGTFLENQKRGLPFLPTGSPPSPAPEPALGSPENPGWYAKLPARIPQKAASAPEPMPFLPGATRSNVSIGNAELTPVGELKGNPTPFPTVQPRAQATGSATQPFEPLVYASPEEAAANDFRMKNLQRQAKAAGTYHAAQGASGKRTNLQQRIQRKVDDE